MRAMHATDLHFNRFWATTLFLHFACITLEILLVTEVQQMLMKTVDGTEVSFDVGQSMDCRTASTRLALMSWAQSPAYAETNFSGFLRFQLRVNPFWLQFCPLVT